MSIIKLACNPELFDGLTEVTMTLPKRRANIKYKNLYGPIPDIPDTLGKEVDAALKEWYTARGQEVPADEIGIGAVIDAAEAAETARLEAAWASAEEVLPSVVPAYGTPEFWAYHRAKKAAENARTVVKAFGSPFETKDKLKARGYRWDSEARVWSTAVKSAEELEAEAKWLKAEVYGGRSARIGLEIQHALVQFSGRSGQSGDRVL
jgi:hypothetical protein